MRNDAPLALPPVGRIRPTAPRLRLAGLLLLGVALLTGSGCVQTAMLPAQQLGAGTTAAGASLDEPGLLHIPRGNLQVTRGVGGGDLSVNVSGPPLGAGVTGRAYLSRRVNAEVQGQVAGLEDAFSLAEGGAPPACYSQACRRCPLAPTTGTSAGRRA